MADMNKGSYRKPRAFNIVTLLIIIGLLAGGFWAYHVGPVYLGRARVKTIVQEAAHKFYKIRSYSTSGRAQASADITKQARAEIIQTLGFSDPELQVEMLIDEEKKLVNVVAQYSHTVTLTPFDKVRVFHFRVVGESDFQDTGL